MELVSWWLQSTPEPAKHQTRVGAPSHLVHSQQGAAFRQAIVTSSRLSESTMCTAMSIFPEATGRNISLISLRALPTRVKALGATLGRGNKESELSFPFAN